MGLKRMRGTKPACAFIGVFRAFGLAALLLAVGRTHTSRCLNLIRPDE